MMTTQLIRQAIAANHTAWFSQIALTAGGGVLQRDGTTCIYKPGAQAEVTIAFPDWSADSASQTLDEILAWCRAHAPIHQIACWSLNAGQPLDLGARLVARGFGWGWQPYWMWLNMQAASLPSVNLANSIQLDVALDAAQWTIAELPNYDRSNALTVTVIRQREPERCGYFAARMNGQVVGHCVAFVSDTPIKMAGLYDVGVVPSARGQGIGLALTVMACEWAKAQGCQHVILNATPMGRPTYRKVGFVPFGEGQTWWMREANLSQPTLRFASLMRPQIELVEALGRGDIVMADALADAFTPDELNRPLLNRGMTLAQLVATMQQPSALDWLARHGADAPTMTRVIPRLPVRDVFGAVAFYTKQLGFSLVYQEFGIAIVTHGAVELHLVRRDSHAEAMGMTCRIMVTQLDGLWRRCVAQRAIASTAVIEKMPWGARQFALTDLDQNTLIFTE